MEYQVQWRAPGIGGAWPRVGSCCMYRGTSDMQEWYLGISAGGFIETALMDRAGLRFTPCKRPASPVNAGNQRCALSLL